MIIQLTIQEAAALDLCSENDRNPDRLIACELNESGLVRIVSDENRIRRTDPKSCPFCGNPKPSVGHMDADRMGVFCECGASIVVPCPEKFPNGIKEMNGVKELEMLDRYMALQAVARWNHRSNK